MKKDRYRETRGGWSRILDITCEKCNHHICFYQKDGPGPLKRMYIDRIIDNGNSEETFICENCGHELGIKINYLKENRPAYRLFQDSVKKKVIRQDNID